MIYEYIKELILNGLHLNMILVLVKMIFKFKYSFFILEI